jgi:hypothetical protein
VTDTHFDLLPAAAGEHLQETVRRVLSSDVILLESPLEAKMRFLSGLVVGGLLCGGVWTLSAQNERAMHPRIATAIAALRDARAYMEAAPHDFGGHKAEAIRATDVAIRQLNLALAYRGREDRR